MGHDAVPPVVELRAAVPVDEDVPGVQVVVVEAGRAGERRQLGRLATALDVVAHNLERLVESPRHDRRAHVGHAERQVSTCSGAARWRSS
jgi:methyl coenzyme M reductase subunit C-like uncharacterized protein (methanogenesis marker protein 7)